MIRECPKCRNVYTDDTLVFCLEDGERLITSAANPLNSTENSMPTVFLPLSNQMKNDLSVIDGKKSSTKYLAIFGSLAGIFILSAVVLGFVYLRGDSAKDKSFMTYDNSNNFVNPLANKNSNSNNINQSEVKSAFTECSLSDADNAKVAEINFNANSIMLTLESSEILKNLSENLKKLPNNCSLEIGVHTDTVGKAELNQKLSSERANSIKNELIKFGLKTNNVIARGYGSSQPIADSSNDENRRKNRRVEFKFFSDNSSTENNKNISSATDDLDFSDPKTLADLKNQGLLIADNEAADLTQKPNPLVLIIEIKSNGDLFLNKQAQGNVLNGTQITEKLRNVFNEREKNGVFKEGTNTVEKTVFIQVPTKINREIFNKTLDLVKDTGTNLIAINSTR